MKRALFLLTLLLSFPAWAAEPTKSSGTLIEFRVDVQKSVVNDLGRAIAFAEVSGADPTEVARKIKGAIADGLTIAKSQPGITVKSGDTHTYPIYGKNSRIIESWRMRSELILESRDAGALSTAIGKLQATLAVGNLQFSPAAETRRKAGDEATLEAIDAFRAKAERIAGVLGRLYRIREMNVNSGGTTMPYLGRRSGAMMAAEQAPMPVEAGESSININVSGQIELID